MILYPSSRFLNTYKVRRFVFPAMLLLLMNMFSSARVSAATDGANASASPMTLAQVVDNLMARNEERARGLKSYEGDRIYTVRYHGFPKDLDARMVVSMQYEAPNTKEFTVISQSGPKFLVDQVLKRLLKTEMDAQRKNTREAVNLDQANYEFSDLEYQPEANGCSYVLSVEPKKPNKYLYRGKIRVNARDFAVCGIQAEPAENPSFWIKSTSIHETYEKVENFWLPEQNKSVSRIRFGGSATLTILYQDYKVQMQQLASTGATSSSGSEGK
ncbi:MAG: hypothetical protein WCE63_03855 [Acidobacteriaceae bacterium]